MGNSGPAIAYSLRLHSHLRLIARILERDTKVLHESGKVQVFNYQNTKIGRGLLS